MRHDEPPPGVGRIFNRSDYAAYFGYLPVVQLLLWITGIVGAVLIGSRLPDPWGFVTGGAVLAFLMFLSVIDRVARFNPVNYIAIGEWLYVVRCGGSVGRYTFPQVLRVEFAPKEGADYDDRERARPSVWLTVVLENAHPATLLVAPESAARLAGWARQAGLPVVDHST